MRHWLALTVLLLGTPFAAAFANDWGNFAIISNTLGNNANRLCIGDANRVSDIGCPSYAPSLTTGGHVSITGNVSANKFIGDGSGLTNLSVQGDRIVSDTHTVIVNQATGYVSLTTGGTTWGYVSAGWSYLANLFTSTVSSSLVSATNVSATYVDATRDGTVSATYGYFRYISGTDVYGSFTGDGSGLTGVIAGAADRIVSGTNAATRMVAISDTGYISITQAGANSGWFDPTRGLVTLGVSATGGISGTSGYFSGPVGISTTAPAGLLDIMMTASSFARFHEAGVAMLNLQSAYTSAPALKIDGTGTADLLRITDNGAPVLYVRDGGFVGISTTTPSVTFHINSNADADVTNASSGALVIGSNNGTQLVLDNNEIMSREGVTSRTLYIQSEGGDVRFGATDSGKVSIGGIAPSALLHVYGGSPTIRIQDSNNGNALVNEQRGGLELTSRHMNAGTARYSSMVKFGSNDNDFGGLTKLLSGIAGYATETYGSTTDSGMGLAFFTTPNDGGVSSTMFERLTIDQNGSIGISTTAPLAKLDVNGTISASDAIQVGSSSLTCGAGIPGAMRYSSGNMQFCNGTSWTTLGSAGAATAASSTGAIQFNVANALAGDTANLFWDDANNRLGVGTADPSSSFEVYGNTNALVRSFVSNPNTGNAAFAEVAARNSTGANDSMRLLAMSSGYASSGPFIADSGVLSADTGLSGGLTLVTRASGAPIRFFTSTSEHMRLSGDGNFGIGTATPTTTLQVSGSFTVSTSTQTTTPSLYVGADGKVGIGTSTPSSTLMVEGGQPGASAGYSQLFINTPNNNQGSALAMRTTNTGTERVWAIMAGTGGGSPNHNLRFYDVTAPAERMTLTTSGNLGIAKAAPLARLDVSGTISASDAIQVGSSGLTCGAGIPGAIRYNSGNLQYCNETNWTTLGPSGGGQGDRIVSGSTSIIAYQDKSLTFITNGTGRMIVDELGNVSFGISNTFATQRYYFYDDQTNKSAYRTVNISPWFKHSTNGTYYNIGMLMSPAVEVGSGISNPGYVYGQWTSLFRRDAPDAGSLDSIVGNVLNVGHYTATGSTRHTSVTTGLMIGMYAQNGTMATMYGLRIISRTGTNVTTSYGISQEGAHDRNYFAGNTGVGQGKTSALANLDVAGTISLTDALHLGQNTIACATGVSGSIRYNTTSNTVQFCNGMGWTSLSSGTTGGGTALGDRITSGTVSVTVNTDGYISLTTGVTDWGYLSSGVSYLPTLVSGRVSATNISATYVQLASATSAVGCDANTVGTTRRNGTTGLLEICQ